jgi:2,3-bisphosphoglycerate-independent phosphoglycerate mutase
MIRPVVLIIMDGWGIAGDTPGNAVFKASTPHFNRFLNMYPHAKLEASGEAVGLPRNEVGNTETGHLNLGAGHIVYQDLPRINMAIADGSFYTNKSFLEALNHVKQYNSTLHVMGLIGAGGVHANNEHLFALIMLCKEHAITQLALHLFTDGRDSPPTVALEYIKRVESELTEHKVGVIASIMGRYYAMDRDERWERTEQAYRALTGAPDTPTYVTVEEVIQKSYQASITDEFIKPCLIKDASGQTHPIRDNDAVIFYNFRIDRPRQLTKAFVYEDFESEAQMVAGFDPFAVRYIKRHIPLFRSSSKPFIRGKKIPNLVFVTMTEYEKNLPVMIAFPPQVIKNPVGKVIADNGLRQLRLAESEKERFVTFYFNGQREMPFVGEDRKILDSLKVATYDQAPQMRTPEITQVLVDKLKENTYDCYIVNFASPDMVGHTGVLPAGIKACEIVDSCLGIVEAAIHQAGGVLLITADHGNVEEMINMTTGGTDTEHSNNPVPFIAISSKFDGKPVELKSGVLADVATTILALLGIEQPVEMSGRNLLSDIGI